jgi:histone H3/H4
MGKKHVFSLYDIEQFLKEAGAERVNERAVISFEEELENTLNDLLNEAEKYANYAGRKNLIKRVDVGLLGKERRMHGYHATAKKATQRDHNGTAANLIANAKITNAASINHI